MEALVGSGLLKSEGMMTMLPMIMKISKTLQSLDKGEIMKKSQNIDLSKYEAIGKIVRELETECREFIKTNPEIIKPIEDTDGSGEINVIETIKFYFESKSNSDPSTQMGEDGQTTDKVMIFMQGMVIDVIGRIMSGKLEMKKLEKECKDILNVMGLDSVLKDCMENNDPSQDLQNMLLGGLGSSKGNKKVTEEEFADLEEMIKRLKRKKKEQKKKEQREKERLEKKKNENKNKKTKLEKEKEKLLKQKKNKSK